MRVRFGRLCRRLTKKAAIQRQYPLKRICLGGIRDPKLRNFSTGPTSLVIRLSIKSSKYKAKLRRSKRASWKKYCQSIKSSRSCTSVESASQTLQQWSVHCKESKRRLCRQSGRNWSCLARNLQWTQGKPPGRRQGTAVSPTIFALRTNH